jgi:hypothetical protein
MRTLLLALLLVIFAAETADARKRRHHYRYIPHSFVVPPGEFGPLLDGDVRAMRPDRADRRRQPPTLAALVPDTWQEQPPDPNWNGKRFLSPDGASWFAAYRTAADKQSTADHMKVVLFGDDETITYLRGERTWVAVSGFKQSRIFYRKAMLACAGKAWHHVAFEYPAELKQRMDQFVIAAAQALENTQSDCGESISQNKP